jgi:lysophospholipase L1-like esterase
MIAEIAEAHSVTYVPLFERQLEELRRESPSPVPYQELTAGGFISTLLQRRVLRRGLDSISRRRGLLLTTDHIHQNARGAALIAEVIDESLLRATPAPNVEVA